MEAERMERPNILLILTDQLRKTGLGCYGNPDVQTPVLDALCRDGLRFDNSVSSAPVCAPYRTTLQSGLYPHQHGVRGNGDLFSPCFKGVAEYFNEAGYETCFVGKSHFGRDEIEEKDGWVRPENRLGWKHWHGTGGDHHYDTPVYDDAGNLDTRYFGRYGAFVRTELAASGRTRRSRGYSSSITASRTSRRCRRSTGSPQRGSACGRSTESSASAFPRKLSKTRTA